MAKGEINNRAYLYVLQQVLTHKLIVWLILWSSQIFS